MTIRFLKLACWLIFISQPLSPGAYSAPKPSVVKYEIRPSWNLTQSENRSYFLEPQYFYKGDLIGANVDDTGGVLICDKITEQLIKLNPGGDVAFSVGKVGEGPEDHRTRGEPLMWFNQQIARSDASSEPKVILYDANGHFLRMVKLNVEGELSRLFWNGESAVSVMTSLKFQGPGGVQFSTYLALIDKDGALVRQHLMNSWVMEKANQHPEEKLWYKPYVAVADDGFTFVQQDLYGSRIDCYDRGLNLVWSIDGGWEPQPRTDQEFAEVEALGVTGLVYCKVNHTIRRIFARENGEVWIQPWNQEVSDGTVEFESFGQDGVRLGTVQISSLPSSNGSWILRGSKLLWMATYVDEDTTSAVPSICVYDLVPR